MADPFLARALEIADASSQEEGRGPFGAVVVRAGEVVGEGTNRVVADGDPTAHAEIRAIRNAGRRLGRHVLEDCVIYSSCEPCPMCLGAIYWAHIPRLVYAASREDAAEIGFDDVRFLEEMGRTWTERALDQEQRDRDEGRAVLLRWAARPDRSPY